MRRRDLLATAAALPALQLPAQTERPNILWITCEDMGPHLGCYGDRYATSPNVDKLAARSLRYLHVWSNAPVCAPARTTIISGMYPPSTGAEHMRSFTRLADGQKMFPVYLREAGYYCTNNVKEDYNIAHTGKVWDESSSKAHWRGRKEGQPFFAVFNFVITHESQIRRRPHTPVHDPAGVRIPAYHPDTPEVRRDWAQYYDNITEMDKMAGRVLAELEQDGLAGNTIVFFYSDHGSGMPRSKRWPYDSGLHVPMLVHVPDKFKNLAPPDYKRGGTTERLVSFVDLAPTVLSLAGIAKPAYHQGHAFLGPAPEQPYVYGFRGRMDERYDLVRSVRDKRFVYIRNYMPQRIYGQHLAYMFETPTTQKWKELYDAGKLNAVQKRFWEKKPAEELYELGTDRDEVVNLAGVPEYRGTLERMRKAQRELAVQIRDVGFLPETEMHSRSEGRAPYSMGHDPARYAVERVAGMADLASRSVRPATEVFVKGLEDSDSGVRYWAAVGLMISGRTSPLQKVLKDPSPCVRIAAAEALQAVDDLVDLADMDRHGIYTALLALNALDTIGVSKVRAAADRIGRLPKDNDRVNDRMKTYAARLIEHILG
ncbi:MAG TPA: sulfatase-like hydrolase/transferase [Bryobacteraceae bacterium]|nr:sulfatase-like hydrolase/transferase [Bryobacteraceae bacterium]